MSKICDWISETKIPLCKKTVLLSKSNNSHLFQYNAKEHNAMKLLSI